MSRSATCPLCGESAIVTREETETFPYGRDGVVLNAVVTIKECRRCEFSYTGDDAEVARHEAVCRHLGRLTPIEICSLRESLGLSRLEFSERAHVDVTSLILWESGTEIQSAESDKVIRAMAESRRRAALRGPELLLIVVMLTMAAADLLLAFGG